MCVVHPEYKIKQVKDGHFKGMWTCQLDINEEYLCDDGSWGILIPHCSYFESEDAIWSTLQQKDEDDRQAYDDFKENQYYENQF